MQNKMYSAFISSVYESLEDERSQVIDSLLDFNIFPICMEHFTAASNRQFKEIEERINNCDFFILIMGSRYGSTDIDGVSWTEKEYDYAINRNIPMVVLFCDELSSLLSKRDSKTLTLDQKRQIKFSDKINFARFVTEELPISKILGQFFVGYDFDKCSGWTRNVTMTNYELEKWQNEHKAYNIAGEWYHVHLSSNDTKYIRTGKITIKQKFDPINFKKCTFEGWNYSLKYNASNGEIFENKLKRTHWSGEYRIDEKGCMFGVFMAKREFTDNFGEYIVQSGIRRGIHDFTLAIDENEEPKMLQGEFHDEAPSPKFGLIYAFRTKKELETFLKENFMVVLQNNQ